MTASHASASSLSLFASARRRLATAAWREARRVTGLFGRAGDPPAAAGRGSLVEPLEGRRLMSVSLTFEPATSTEGTYLFQTVTATGSGYYTATIDWGDGQTGEVSGSAGESTTVAHTYADDGTYPLTATGTAYGYDAAGNPTGPFPVSASGEAKIANVAPTFELSPPYYPVPTGETATFGIDGFNDVGQDTVSSWTLDWGDGTSDTYAGDVRAFDHVFEVGGDYTVTATAFDEDGSYTRTADVTFVSKIKSTWLPRPR